MRKAAFSILTVLLTCASALADVTLSGTQLLRSYEIENNELLERPTGRAGLTSYRFLTQVGGVNFELFANLPSVFTDGLDRIEYDPSKPDGERVSLHTSDGTFIIPVHDWILIPTVHYSNSPYSAAVSLLGGETNSQRFHVRYHPELEDTLLGLRLLQADLLPLDLSVAMELPKIDGQTVLEAGETQGSQETAALAAAAIQLSLLFSDPSPSSWILTDVGTREYVPIVVDGNRLIADPQIYYSFWYCKDREVCESTDTVTVLHELNAEMREAPWSEVNSPVWSAAETIAGYSAVFRTIATSSPEVWASFYETVPSEVSSVETPNLIPRGAF